MKDNSGRRVSPIFGTMTLVGSLTLLIVAAAGAAFGQTPPPAPVEPSWKVSGFMFGDYYYVAKHHVSTIDGMNGFWFRRIYFTYDQKLEAGFSTRFRLEMNSPGDFKSSATLNPFVKDAYLQYARGAQKALFGIVSTPTWENMENVLGYRPVEKTPVDLYRLGSARDFGVGLRGSLGAEEKASYSVLVGNGNGVRSETDKGKAFYGNLIYRFNPTVQVEGYADIMDKPGKTNWMTQAATFYILTERFHASLLYVHQKRDAEIGQALTLDVFSAYGDVKLAPRVKVFGRFDALSDPVPDADKIDYLVLSPTAKPTFGMFGMTLDLIKGVQLTPNVELVRYSDPVAGTTKPNNDVIGKITLYYSWKS